MRFPGTRILFPGDSRRPENAIFGSKSFFPDIPGYQNISIFGSKMGPEIGPNQSPENESGLKKRSHKTTYRDHNNFGLVFIRVPLL